MRALVQFIISRAGFAAILLAMAAAYAVLSLLRDDVSCEPTEWILSLAALVLGASLFFSRRRAVAELWPEGRTLWGICGLALAFVYTSGAVWFASPWQAPLPFVMAMGCLCLLWAGLGRWSLVFWVPFMAIELAQAGGFLQYGTRLNSLVIAETLESSAAEAAAYLTWGNIALIFAAIAGACVFSFLIARVLHEQKRLPLFHAGLAFVAGAALLGMCIPAQLQANESWWPASEAVRIVQSWREARFHNVATIRQVESLRPPSDQPSSLSTLKGGEGVVLVVHIGESVRADRMSINGYRRDTTPWLRSRKEIINFPDCISAACDTCQAQIAILTDARRGVHETDPAFVPHTGSVLSLFDAHGFKVYSFFGMRRAQQLKYDRVVRMLTKCSVRSFNAPGSPWTSVPQMAETLRANNAGQNLVFFINNEGSHTPFDHYDLGKPPFLPAGAGFGNPAGHAQEVNNAYDNTVHYMDEFVRRVAQLLQGRPFVYLYVSDHGEYLGHDGMWGRAALGEKAVKYHNTQGCRVGMFMLVSPDFEKLHPHFAEAAGQLRIHAGMTVGHEHIFHTLLGLFGIGTPFYDPQLDLAAPTAQPYAGDRPADEAHPDALWEP